MRKLNDHIVEGDSVNHQLEIRVLDDPGAGGAHHLYEICHVDKNFREVFSILGFQNGPIKESGVNGITQEALLVVVMDRLRSFQAGPFASEYNQAALVHCEIALACLQQRTRERIARGVEGQTKA